MAIPRAGPCEGGPHWLERLAPDLDPARPVRELAVGERQIVELAKVLNLNARIVILDEPTSVLTPAEPNGSMALSGRWSRKAKPWC